MALSEVFSSSQRFSHFALPAQKNFTVSKSNRNGIFFIAIIRARVVSFSFNLYVIYLSLLLFPFFSLTLLNMHRFLRREQKVNRAMLKIYWTFFGGEKIYRLAKVMTKSM
jgi:hypothetical protein